MKINGKSLPRRFIQCIESGELDRAVGSWPMAKVDAYGNPIQSELAEFYETESQIQEATDQVSRNFAEDGCYGEASEWIDEPGFIPDVTDFREVICFGYSGDDGPFCFDYRQRKRPSVIWWDDVYWRRIAPGFGAFLNLLKR